MSRCGQSHKTVNNGVITVLTSLMDLGDTVSRPSGNILIKDLGQMALNLGPVLIKPV